MPIQILEARYTLQFNDVEKFVLLQRLKGKPHRDERDESVILKFIQILESAGEDA